MIEDIPFWFNLHAKTIILTCYSVKVLAQWIIFLTFPLPHCLKTEYKIGWFFMLGACWLVGGMYPRWFSSYERLFKPVPYGNISYRRSQLRIMRYYLEVTWIVLRDFMQEITRFCIIIIILCKVITKWMLNMFKDHACIGSNRTYVWTLQNQIFTYHCE